MDDKAISLNKRRWWIALPLSLLWGGGYLYVGRPYRYVAYLAITLALIAAPLHGLWGWLSQPFVLLAYVAGFGIFILAAIIDTTRLAVVQNHYVCRWYNRWWLYAAAFLLAIYGMSWVPEVTTATIAVRNYNVPSVSNAPTLRLGEIFTADTRAYVHRDPQRGDMVIFKGPTGPANVAYVKRVIGLPGDVIQMIGGKVLINGDAVEQKRVDDTGIQSGATGQQYLETLPNGRSYRVLISEEGSGKGSGTYRVPSNQYFVLGDNRGQSDDSRFGIGYVPRENIHALAVGVIYSNELSRIGTRLN